MLTVGDKIYCYWTLDLLIYYRFKFVTVTHVDLCGFMADLNLTFSYDNNKNNAIKYMTLKQLRKNKLKKILCSQ